ncbi:MAG: A/G-specific adenine glycosylase [Alphaproteobacteria bacterium]|nr:A/G-specific adenine glycosylase [Alphaproteobacteria bacterium]
MKAEKTHRLRAQLLDWYDAQGRSLPWRIRPEDRAAGRKADPYAVWLSEIMLQQTTVPHATPYWFRFLELWPTVHDLANADREAVMREWAGLGYYARARNLHACAKVVSHDRQGVFPHSLSDLQALPGIGEYTANAIRAAAFDLPASVVDGNVERVITRLKRVQEALPKAKAEIKALAGLIADPDRSCDYAQAIMDLGATVCTPKTPNCLLCPWASDCEARREGDILLYPKKEKKKPKPVRRGTAWLVRRDGHVWLRTRPDQGLLGGMREVPSTPWQEEVQSEVLPPFEALWRGHGEIKHVFTHFELRLDVREAYAMIDWEPEDGDWVAETALAEEALPSVMRKVLKQASLKAK